MPRDNDKDNAFRRGRRDRAGPGKARAEGGGRGGKRTFTKRGFAGKRDEARGHHREERDGRPMRREARDEFPRKRFDRQDKERGTRKPWRDRDERVREPHRGEEYPRSSRSRPARAHEDRPQSASPRFERPRRDGKEDREGTTRRPRDEFPHKRFGRQDKEDGTRKPWRDRVERSGEQRQDEERPRYSRSRPGRDQEDRRQFASPRFERPRRDTSEDREGATRRPAFGGRGAYRERKRDLDERGPREQLRPKKTGERIAKVLARAGLASRREAEDWIKQGRIAVNGRVINSPALDVTAADTIAVDGQPLPPRERTRLFFYHKPRGLMTTHADPEGRPTVFDNLPQGLPRLISVGRLDFNTEGLLLLTNDGGLARVLELPETGWLRRYRVRAHGEVTQAQLDELKKGAEVDGIKYGPIDAALEHAQGSNVWLVFAIREGKNREVRNVLAHLGLEVNRLIRISYGPFQLGELGEGQVEEIKTRVLREQLGEKLIAQAGADFALPASETRDVEDNTRAASGGKRPFKPSGKSALIADRKGRRVLVQRGGTDKHEHREEDRGYGPPRRPKRGYHGKRDVKPRDG